MASEAGHHANRVYIGQDGNIYLNGANVYDAAGVAVTPLRGGTYTQTYSTAARTVPLPTAATLVHAAVGGTANGTLVDCTGTYSEAAVEENFKELATTVNLLIDDQLALFKLVTALIDDLQASGLVG